jgi:AAA+ ATPase superfamily predicted ATPase
MEIEFHDREREIKEITRILYSRPDLITFVYGPINSGKTELFQYFIRKLPDEFVVFYINLRHVYVSKAEDFLKILFDIRGRRVSVKAIAKEVIETYVPREVVTPLGRFPIPKNVFKELFKEKAIENVFVYLENLLREIAKKKKPILILDELQKIGDVKIDGLLIYELFNFFIGLTKESHLAHVFAITSDSLFIERVFAEAMLHGRCRYLLVDDFDYETTAKFLEKYGFSIEEIELAWEYLGGKPIYLVEAVKNRDRLREFCEGLVRLRKRQIKDLFYRLDEEFRKSVLDILSQFRDEETITYEYLTSELTWCVRNNILFLDPTNEIIKPQSRIDLLAVRKILSEIS